MENILIKPRNLSLGRMLSGGLWILVGIILLIFNKDSTGNLDWSKPIIFFILGIAQFTPIIGSGKIQIEIYDEGLKMIWLNWYRKVTIRDSEIESITLGSKGIIIKRKDKRPLKVFFYVLDKEQKNQVYKFFTEYAENKNFVLKR